jgi:hypothetical protein
MANLSDGGSNTSDYVTRKCSGLPVISLLGSGSRQGFGDRRSTLEMLDAFRYQNSYTPVRCGKPLSLLTDCKIGHKREAYQTLF